jgi:hypothetical protein
VALGSGKRTIRVDSGLILEPLEDRRLGYEYGRCLLYTFGHRGAAQYLWRNYYEDSSANRDTSREKLAWWTLGGNEVAATYGQFFPKSYILAFRRFVFWLVVACAASILMAVLWRSR